MHDNSRQLWPIDVKFSGVMDMGKTMMPDPKWLTYQRSKGLKIVRSDGYGHEDQMIGATTHSKMVNLSEVKRFNFIVFTITIDLKNQFIFNFQE